jgi:hypothetical protein
MKTFCLALFLVPGIAAFGHAAETDWQPLCNGKDLSGWTSKPDLSHWSLQDGVIVGANGPDKKGSVLWTDAEFGDFVLQIDFRFSGTVDSGILVKGKYQVNIGISSSLRRDMTCSIYAPWDGRGKYPGLAEGIPELLQPDDWNHLQVEAKGKRIIVSLNGQQVVDYETKDLPATGPIGLQVHAGHDMKIEFRHPRIRRQD